MEFSSVIPSVLGPMVIIKDRKRKITTVSFFPCIYFLEINLEWENLRLLPEIYGPNYSFRPLVSPKIGFDDMTTVYRAFMTTVYRLVIKAPIPKLGYLCIPIVDLSVISTNIYIIYI